MPYKKKQDKEAPSIKPEKSKHYIKNTFTYQLNCSSGFSFTIPPIPVSYGNTRHPPKDITSPLQKCWQGDLSLAALPQTAS